MRHRLVKCSEVARHICDNLDEKINSARCREIKRHLLRCPNCTAYLDSVKKTVSLYKMQPSPAVSSRVHRQILAVVKRGHSPRGSRKRHGTP